VEELAVLVDLLMAGPLREVSQCHQLVVVLEKGRLLAERKHLEKVECEY
jgi:hypothetical protein